MENILCSSSGSRSCDACLEERKSGANKEIALAEMFCVNCKEKLCTECCNQHKKFKLTKAHKFIALSELQTEQDSIKDRLVPNVCALHDQAFNTYCKDCKTVMCSSCFVDKHKGHDGSLFKRIGDEFREKIQGRVDSLFTCASAAQARKANLEMEKTRTLETMKDVEEKIIGRRDNLKKLADNHAQDLLQALDSLKQTRLKEIQTATDNVDRHLKSLGSYSLYCKDIIARGSYSDVCRSVNGLITKGDSLQQQNREMMDTHIGDFDVFYSESNLEQLFHNDCPNIFGSIAVNRSKDLQQTMEPEKKETEQLCNQLQPLEVNRSKDLQQTTEPQKTEAERIRNQPQASKDAHEMLRYRKSEVLGTSPYFVYEAPSKPFDDKTLIAEGESLFVTGMTISLMRWDDKTIVGGIEVRYSCGKSALHGSNNYGQAVYEFSLRPGEKIIGVNACSGWMVDQLSFTTSNGRVFGPYGGSGGSKKHILGHNDGTFLAYITGTVDVTQQKSAVRKLCFVWGYQEKI